MRVCTAIKANGERCKASATSGSEWCWNHDPAHAEKRRIHGSIGGKRGGRGRPQSELARIQERLEELVDDVLDGRVDRSDAAVAGQLLNYLIRAVSVGLKVKEQLELIDRLERLETNIEANKRSRYGA